jgi:epoxyqueuosine reductase
MYDSHDVKKLATLQGAEACGITGIDRFADAPEGFKPADIYERCRSVVVFLRAMPPEIILAANPVPYTHAAYLMYAELDRIGLILCRKLEAQGGHAVPVPADVPYVYWDAAKSHGKGILSLRHAARNAGLGFLGRNTLLINPAMGNMAYIGAILTDAELEPDPVMTDLACPPNCRACLDACPQNARDGATVDQAACRKHSFVKTGRGFDLYNCSTCRRVCPYRLGIPSAKLQKK